MKQILDSVATEINGKVRIIKSDNAREITVIRTKSVLDEYGVRHELTVAHTPKGNEKAEREVQTIKECGRTIFLASKLQEFLWDEAVKAAVYVLSRSLARNELKTPYINYS